MKHKSDDYKISAVKYYLNNKDNNIRKTCKIFDCNKSIRLVIVYEYAYIRYLNASAEIIDKETYHMSAGFIGAYIVNIIAVK